MKRSSTSFVSILLGLVCAVFSVSGCILFDAPADSSLVKFSAASSLKTKVHYGDFDDPFNPKHIQLVWDDEDVIRIASDRAKTAGGADSYDYMLEHDREEGTRSFAKFKQSNNQSGLRWEDSGTYNFYATYPAVEVNAQNGTFSASLPSHEYLMVAHTSTSYNPNNKVFLSFYPAFTAIEITIYNDDPDNVWIDDCSLSTPSSSSYPELVGDFTAAIGDEYLSGLSIREGSHYADPVSKEPLYNDEGMQFMFFCLPQDLYNLSLTCYYTKNGSAFSKTIELKESGRSLSFEACKYHRLALTVNSEGGDDIELSLTLGGAQMLLMTLRNNSTKIISGLKAYYGIGPGDASQYPNGAQFNAMLRSIQEKTSSNADQFIKDHFWEADVVFLGGKSYSFTTEELKILRQAVLPLITKTGTIGQEDYSKITSYILASDFLWLPNLEEITHMETRQNLSPRPSLEVGNVPSLNYIELNQYTYVTVRGSEDSDVLTLNMMNANNSEGAIYIEDLRFNDQFNIGNQHPKGPVTFKNVSGIQQLNLGNATAVSMYNCPDLERVNVQTAINLTSFDIENCDNFTNFAIQNAGNPFKSLTLWNTPYFEDGYATTTLTDFTVTLASCSYNYTGTPYINLPNTKSSSVTVIKDDRSGRVEVRTQN